MRRKLDKIRNLENNGFLLFVKKKQPCTVMFRPGQMFEKTHLRLIS